MRPSIATHFIRLIFDAGFLLYNLVNTFNLTVGFFQVGCKRGAEFFYLMRREKVYLMHA